MKDEKKNAAKRVSSVKIELPKTDSNAAINGYAIESPSF